MEQVRDYSLEELYPVFERLSRRYMGADTASIPYEKAQSLMSAVIYCINHCGETLPDKNTFTVNNPLDDNVCRNMAFDGCIGALEKKRGTFTAEEAYKTGLEAVHTKTREAVDIYREIMKGFDSFGSRACSDTITKGIPEFFKWYDPEYDPENHMLTFDYPVLRPIESLAGIDAIYTYLECIRCEQIFLHGFTAEAVTGFLQLENSGYSDLFENVCRPVVRRAVLCMLAGCMVAELKIVRENLDELCSRLEGYTQAELQQFFEKALTTLINKGYGDNQALLSYLKPDMYDFAFEFVSARNNNYLNRLIRCNLI